MSMDIYGSLAAILASSSSSTTTPTSLIATQLSSAPHDQKPAFARVLAELLRGNADGNAQTVLHDYIRSLVSAVDLDDVSADFKLAVELADEGLLLQILDETVASLRALISRAANVHISSDDAFALDSKDFLEKYLDGVKNEQLESDHVTVVRQLRFWHFLFMTGKAYPELYLRIGVVLPTRLLAAMGLRDSSVAKAAGNSLCCFVNDFHRFLPVAASEMLWDGISRLVSAEVHVDVALALWLRWIAATSANVAPTQEILKTDLYWVLIQKCLSTGFSERRKYSLNLLTTSLSLTTSSVSTRTFTFEPTKRKEITAAWSKYNTLVEIVSLSTSPNQLRDATPDLKRLLNPTSHVPSSWIVALTILGFQAGSGGVSRTFWDILLTLENDRLCRLFEGPEGTKLLQDVLLPFAAQAGNFSVSKAHPEVCEHGTQMANWIGKLLAAGDVNMTKSLVKALMNWIDATEDNIFAPARAWMLKGILEGVQGKKVFDEVADVKLLVKIAKMRRFTRMKADVCIAIIFKLLLAIDLEKVGLNTFWNAFAEIAYKKQYLLSEKYMISIVNEFGPSLMEKDSFSFVMKMAFPLPKEAIPSRVDLLKAVLIMQWLACDERMPEKMFPGRDMWIQILHTSRLSFWSVALGNQALFRRLAKIYGGSAVILPRLLRNTQANTADLAELLELWPEDALGGASTIPTDVNVIPKVFQLGWMKLQDAKADAFEQVEGRLRADSAVVCAHAAKLIGYSIFYRIHIGDIVDLITHYDLPKLGRNKHDNIEMTVTAGRYIGAILRVLDGAVTVAKELDHVTVSRIFKELPRHMRFLEGDSLLSALSVIRGVATAAVEPSKLNEAGLADLIQQLWETVDATTLRADFVKSYHGFIETIFHPVIIEEAVEDEGLRDTVIELTQEIMKLGNGRRSIKPAIAKAIRKAFLHSPRHPAVIGRSHWLIDVAIELILWSPNPKDNDIIVEHPLITLFDDVTPEVDHYAEYFGDLEIYSQVYMFDMLSRMSETDVDQSAFVTELRNRLFTPWTANFTGMSVWVAWKRHSHLQTLILTERFLKSSSIEEFLDLAINKALCHEPHPRFRFLFEWIISLAILRFPDHRNVIWEHLHYPRNQNPKLQVSLLRVGLMVARNLPPDLREAYFTELVLTAVPLTSNTKVVVRHQAIAMQIELWEDAHKFEYDSLTANPLFRQTHVAVINSPYFKEFQNAKDYRTFEPVGNFTITTICSGNYLKEGDEVEIIPASAFADLAATPVESEGQKLRLPLGSLPSADSAAEEKEAKEAPHSGAVAYNRHDLEQIASLSAAAEEENNIAIQTKAAAPSANNREIIMCASLIDKGFNLGGLSRVSEIMGVKTLTIPSKAVMKEKEFAAVSVHSESWLDIQEVQVPDITAFLREKRMEGYEAVGVEQTDRSVVLGSEECDKKWSNKVLLLMGTEKFGIPAELLGELDWCVEIPQKGMTRSMNVQTAAAVVLYDVSK